MSVKPELAFDVCWEVYRGAREDDCAFQGMLVDKEYQGEALRIAEQFAASDAEALDITEQDMSKT
jgi:hypothetical protein